MQEGVAESRDVAPKESLKARMRRRSGEALWKYGAPVMVHAARRNLGRKARSITDYRSAVSFVFGYKYLGLTIAPGQVPSEIEGLLAELAAKKPRIVLEIGTYRGGTLFLFSRVATDDARLISVDLPGGQFGGGYPSWKNPLYESFAKGSQQVRLIRGDSHLRTTMEAAAGLTDGGEVDFLFIDGDHTYEGVKSDFELYSGLVAKGGMVAFHDILPHTTVPDVGVHRYWDEIKGSYDSHEIVADRAQGWAGIGVITIR